MTSQAYQADDGQIAQEHDQMIPEGNQTKPDADLALMDAGQDVADGQAQPDAYHLGYEAPSSYPASVAALADDGSATFPASDYPDLTPVDDDGADEPEATASNAASPSLASVVAMVPELVTESHLGGNSARATGPWNAIQAMFVDDPRASVERADGLVDDRVEALLQSVRKQLRTVQSAWRADDAGTEELRVALQGYRALWISLEDFPARA